MDEVAVASPLTLAFVGLSTLRLTEVSDRTVLNNDLIHVVKLAIKGFEAGLCLLLRAKLDIYITHHVLSDVVCDY